MQHPFILIDDGQWHDMPTTPGVFIIVMNGGVYVRDGAQVVALGAESQVRLAGTATAVAYHGAQIQQEGPATVATAYGPSRIISAAGEAHVFGESQLFLVKGGTTNAWLHNSAQGNVFSTHPGEIHLYDMATLSAPSGEVLNAINVLRLPSPSASLWVEDVQYLQNDDFSVAPAVPAPSAADIHKAGAEAHQPDLSAADDTDAAVANDGSGFFAEPEPESLPPITFNDSLSPTAQSIPENSTADSIPVPPRAPIQFEDRSDSTSAPGGLDYPPGAPEGLPLYSDFDHQPLRFSDWHDMQPWSRSPWFTVTPSSGKRDTSQIPALEFVSAASDSSSRGSLGTIELPDADSFGGNTFTPPGM
ncbi:hypothetical protein [Gordonia sihwensis]|uniref:hypothetical protein n=1 Tax=Gordonia sihwensis TaxID=173559 RepID=UPI003D958C58